MNTMAKATDGLVVVFDCESDCTFKSLGGLCREEAYMRMQATVVCALVLKTRHCNHPGARKQALETAEAHHWWRDETTVEGQGPFSGLLKLFDVADCIVAYNGLDFDFHLLRKHYGNSKTARRRWMEHRAKCHDPFARLRATTDLWFKLDVLLVANGIPAKTGTGLEAIKLWEQGRREELLAYCTQDVRCLAELVLQDTIEAPNVGTLANHVHGVASALAGFRALRPVEPLEPTREDDFVMVHTGETHAYRL